MTYGSIATELFYSLFKAGVLFLTLCSMAIRDVALWVGRKADGWVMDGHRQIERLGEAE